MVGLPEESDGPSELSHRPSHRHHQTPDELIGKLGREVFSSRFPHGSVALDIHLDFTPRCLVRLRIEKQDRQGSFAFDEVSSCHSSALLTQQVNEVVPKLIGPTEAFQTRPDRGDFLLTGRPREQPTPVEMRAMAPSFQWPCRYNPTVMLLRLDFATFSRA